PPMGGPAPHAHGPVADPELWPCSRDRTWDVGSNRPGSVAGVARVDPSLDPGTIAGGPPWRAQSGGSAAPDMRQIRAWAAAHRTRTGERPKCNSGAILGSDGETWHKVDVALRLGTRGLPGSSSLLMLLSPLRRGTRAPGRNPGTLCG